MSSAASASVVRVLLADDHPILRAGVRALIDGHHGIEVVGEAADGDTACRETEHLRPDVLVIDFSMPGLDGGTATKRARALHPPLRVVALTVHEDPSYISHMMQAGAMGYVLKRSAADELVRAIKTVVRGEVYVDPALDPLVAQSVLPKRATAPGAVTEPSKRELEVLRLYCRGVSSKEIAAHLKVSTRTVETHIIRVREKLGVRGRADLVQYAIRRGLLDEPV